MEIRPIPVVNSYNEWDPLEEAIVGALDGATVPEWHVQLKSTMPEKYWDFYKKQHQLFYILLELKAGVSYNKKEMAKMKKKYHDVIIKQLKQANFDYAGSYRDDKTQADSRIEIYEAGTGPFANDLKRTKPRLVLKR